MKRVLCVVLAVILTAGMVTACASQQTPQNAGSIHTVYFKDKSKSDTATAIFRSSKGGAGKEVEMTKISEDEDSCTFSCAEDTDLYNMVYFTYGDDRTKEVAFNKCTSGWYNSEYGFLPYTQGKEIDYFPQFEHIPLTFNGYEKKIHIWKPDDYDPDSDEKYAVICMLDGQDFAYIGEHRRQPKDCENAPEQVVAMTESTGYKAIVVAIDTYGDGELHNYVRDDELIPDIGEMSEFSFEYLINKDRLKRCGNQFADFVAEGVVPYVREHYNVYGDALHTAISGESLGGLEAFYIAVEYPDVFGTAAALSPSFWTYEDDVWRAYLSQKDFASDPAFLYLYTGGGLDTDDAAVSGMVDRLNEMGYPGDKIAYHYNDDGAHTVANWRSIFSEFLTAMVFRHIEPLQGSAATPDEP